MQIAIVDDDPTLRITLKHFLKKWFQNENLPLELFEFNSGNEFLTNNAEKKYDIVFMDIFMEKKNGIETASEMRSFDKDTILVFLTSSADYMPDAFSVHAFGYLLKPLLPDKLFKIMDDVKSLFFDDEPTLEFLSGKITLNPKYSEIIYIQSDSNYCIIHCPTPCKSRGPFSSHCEPLYADERFCIINRGILVNFDHVKEMDNCECLMDNGDILPINTKKASQLKLQFQAYKFKHR